MSLPNELINIIEDYYDQEAYELLSWKEKIEEFWMTQIEKEKEKEEKNEFLECLFHIIFDLFLNYLDSYMFYFPQEHHRCYNDFNYIIFSSQICLQTESRVWTCFAIGVKNMCLDQLFPCVHTEFCMLDPLLPGEKCFCTPGTPKFKLQQTNRSYGFMKEWVIAWLSNTNGYKRKITFLGNLLSWEQ